MKSKYSIDKRKSILSENLSYEKLCEKYDLRKGTLASWASRLNISRIGGRPKKLGNSLDDILKNTKKFGDCLFWANSKRNGYGRIWYNGRLRTLTHVIYSLYHRISIESISPNIIMHSCDNPPCINPNHLILGTQKENMEDCAKKGRIRN